MIGAAENREAESSIKLWLERNPGATPEQRRHAEHALLSCRNADRRDCQDEINQRLHRQNLQAFVAAVGGV